MDQFTIKDLQKYAWDYFQLHSNQRMTAFNYFMAFSALAATGLGATFQQNGMKFRFIGAVLSGVLILIAFAFWKIDQRTRELIKNAEKALIYLESEFPPALKATEAHCTQLFLYEESASQIPTHLRWLQRLSKPISYTRSFNIIFGVVALCGVCGLVISLVTLIK
jgi:hypothetical protein